MKNPKSSSSTSKPTPTGSKNLKSSLFLKCSNHGEVLWRGTVACEVCSRVFLMRSEGQELLAGDIDMPHQCTCGAILFNPKNPHETSAMPCCESCYQARKGLTTLHLAKSGKPPSA